MLEKEVVPFCIRALDLSHIPWARVVDDGH